MSDPSGYREVPDVELARRAIDGEQEAFGLLFGRWFDRAFDVAWYIHYDREAAADSVADAFAAAWQQVGDLRQPESFGGWLLRITRNQSLNRLRKDRRSRPIGTEDALVSLDDRESVGPDEQLGREEQQELVWAASEALGDDDASLLHLHLRHHLEPAELAEELGVQPNAAHQRLHRLRSRLGEAIGAWLLWHRGQPACAELASSLSDLSDGGFDRKTAKAVLRHAKGCDECSERRASQTRPEMLFSVVPLVMVDPAVRSQVATALSGMDVPAVEGAPDQLGSLDEVAGNRWGSSEEPPANQWHSSRGEDLPGKEDLPDKDAGTGSEKDEAEWEQQTEDLHELRAEDAARRSGGGMRDKLAGKPVLTGTAVAVVVTVIAVSLFTFVTWSDSGGGDRTETVAAEGESTTTTTRPGVVLEATEAREGDDGLPAKEDSDDEAVEADDDPVVEAPTGTVPESPDPTVPPADPPPSTGGDPPNPPPSDPPPTTDPPEPAGPPPEVTSFVMDPAGYCPDQSRDVYFGWTTTDGSSATLTSPEGVVESVALNGSVNRCTQGGTWTLTVTSPGGTDSATAEVPVILY